MNPRCAVPSAGAPDAPLLLLALPKSLWVQWHRSHAGIGMVKPGEMQQASSKQHGVSRAVHG